LQIISFLQFLALGTFFFLFWLCWEDSSE
jgi:hypothetical protein